MIQRYGLLGELFFVCPGPGGDSDEINVALVQYIKVTAPLDKLGWVLSSVIVIWSPSENEKDYSVTNYVPTEDVIEAGEWYGGGSTRMIDGYRTPCKGNSSCTSFHW